MTKTGLLFWNVHSLMVSRGMQLREQSVVIEGGAGQSPELGSRGFCTALKTQIHVRSKLRRKEAPPSCHLKPIEIPGVNEVYLTSSSLFTWCLSQWLFHYFWNTWTNFGNILVGQTNHDQGLNSKAGAGPSEATCGVAPSPQVHAGPASQALVAQQKPLILSP